MFTLTNMRLFVQTAPGTRGGGKLGFGAMGISGGSDLGTGSANQGSPHSFLSSLDLLLGNSASKHSWTQIMTLVHALKPFPSAESLRSVK